MYYKYLKYKIKYFNLLNLIGGGKVSALSKMLGLLKLKEPLVTQDQYTKFKFFIDMNEDDFKTDANIAEIKKLNKEDISIINTARENNKKNGLFRRLIENLERDWRQGLINLVPLENNEDDLKVLFDLIYDSLSDQLEELGQNDVMLNKYIDFIIDSYINNTFGEPSSLKNIKAFKDAALKYEILVNNSHIIESPIMVENPVILTPLNKLNGLIGLTQYLENPYISTLFRIIDKIKQEQEAKRQAELKKKTKGETTAIFENDNILIYNPRTMDESIYYGSNTKWCTASSNKEKNLFKKYNDDGNLYIIINKRNQTIKFQLHLESDSLNNVLDSSITISTMLSQLNNDTYLITWLKELVSKNLKKNIFIENNELNVNITKILLQFNAGDRQEIINILLSRIEGRTDLPNITRLNYLSNSPDILRLLLDRGLLRYILTVYINYKETTSPLENSLRFFTLINHLILNNKIYDPLGDSLSMLINLTHLEFRESFNEPLGHSLYNLNNLTNLIFSDSFNKPLDDSLNMLKKLTHLKFGNSFNEPLGHSLYHLINLTYLELGYSFNKPLDDSLNMLINLTHLKFGNAFNQPLGYSLYHLINLTHLTFGYLFNQQLDNSLFMLINLTHLKFGHRFNQPLGDSLSKLSKLMYLEFDYDFNQPLGHSLDNLINLTHLKLGIRYTQPLKTSISHLSESLYLEIGYSGYKQYKEIMHSIK